MSRIGILGGSFDPPHRAHLQMAREAVSSLQLDRLLFVPAFRAPLSSHPPRSSASQRINMLNLLVNLVPESQISTYELDQKREVPTYETVTQIKRENAGVDLYLIIGGDQAAQFDRWQKWQELLGLVSVVVFGREGQNTSAVLTDQVIEITMNRPISSSDIRARIRKGADLGDLLPPELSDYIDREQIYR